MPDLHPWRRQPRSARWLRQHRRARPDWRRISGSRRARWARERPRRPYRAPRNDDDVFAVLSSMGSSTDHLEDASRRSLLTSSTPPSAILTGTPQLCLRTVHSPDAKSRSSKSPTGSNASMWWCDQSLWSLSFTASIAPSALSLRSSTMSFALPDAVVGLAFVLEVVVVGEVAGSFLGAALEVVGGAIHGVAPDVGRVSELVSTVPCVGRFEPARRDFTLRGEACSLAQGFVHGHGVSRRAFQRSRSTARRAMPRSSAARTAWRVV